MKGEKGRGNVSREEKSYYAKDPEKDIFADIQFPNGVMMGNLTQTGKYLSGTPIKFIGRSSLRIVPKIEEISYSESTIREDIDAPLFHIDYDTRFNADVVKYTFDINKALREPAFKGQNADTAKIFQEHIAPFNLALKNIFPQSDDTSIQLVQFEDALPGQPIKLLFRKGEHLINYDLLSHGEKQVIIILLNFMVRKEQIKNSIYFIDEMDAHLNTALQFNLLKEITENWVPDDAQLWTASHSLGFIDYARQAEHAVILDFDDRNFDLPQIIVPEPKDNMEVYEIAVGKNMLARLFQGMVILFVENKDDQYYNNLALPHTIFVPEQNKAAVYHKARTSDFRGIIDRDFLTDQEIADIEVSYPNLKILRYYSIENYMYHPDNLQEYYSGTGQPFDRAQYTAALTAAKNEVIENMILGLVSNRMSYPFYKEHGRTRDARFENKSENQQQAQIVRDYLRSDDLETFYKVFPMKDYARQLPQRQNIPPSKLAATRWFGQQIQALLTAPTPLPPQ
ncbi:MAG: ATP-binding protein [Saprospiraceae bacterium]|nr:ATP-binding protein [Saprospiraceae bacterium]